MANKQQFYREPAPCTPGSIEQQTDMCEQGELRGDDISFHHGQDVSRDRDPLDNFSVDLSEQGREGDEMSGDDHSSGLQGGETEIENQPHIETGMPGDDTQRNDQPAELAKRRAA